MGKYEYEAKIKSLKENLDSLTNTRNRGWEDPTILDIPMAIIQVLLAAEEAAYEAYKGSDAYLLEEADTEENDIFSEDEVA